MGLTAENVGSEKFRVLVPLGLRFRDRGRIHPLLQRLNGDGREAHNLLPALEAESILNTRNAMHMRPCDTGFG